jgi:hypothetical protein
VPANLADQQHPAGPFWLMPERLIWRCSWPVRLVAPDGTLYFAYIKHGCLRRPGHVLFQSLTGWQSNWQYVWRLGQPGLLMVAGNTKGLHSSSLSTGAYIVTWVSLRTGDTFAGFEDVYAQYFDANDAALAGDARLTHVLPMRHPSLAKIRVVCRLCLSGRIGLTRSTVMDRHRASCTTSPHGTRAAR